MTRFLRDESGQGIVFAAATLLLLVGFVALVYNIGRVVERRTKMQLGADSAAYAGAMVEGNSLSAIGWINSAMAQIYYNSLKYAVDVNVSGVAAELENRLGQSPGPALAAYQSAYSTAKTALPQAKQWMVDLSRIENAIAILTPRLAEEEMYAVAGETGAERISVYPSFRMFPHAGSSLSYKIERLPNGWRVTNIAGGNGDSLSVTLNGNTWDMQYSHDGIVNHEVTVAQESPTKWDIQYFQPPGTLVQQISIVKDPNLGWIVWGTTGNPPTPIPTITFNTVPVQTPEGVPVNGTQITQGGTSQVLWMGADGNLYSCNWDLNLRQWVVAVPALTSSQTTIVGVNVNVNVTNVINFPGGSARVGNPTVVYIGGATIVLSNPPNISTSFGPVRISISGFTPNSFNISVGDWSLTPGDSDGRWRKYYNPIEELWWRHRLVVMGMDGNNQPNLWQYDRQVLGALMAYDYPTPQNWPGRFVTHVFVDRGLDPTKCEWLLNPNGNGGKGSGWFEGGTDLNSMAKPHVSVNNNLTLGLNAFTNPDGSLNIVNNPGGGFHYQITAQHLLTIQNDHTLYYQTCSGPCPICQGNGGQMVNNAWQICPACGGKDWNGNEFTQIRVFIWDFANDPAIAQHYPGFSTQNGGWPEAYFTSAPMFCKTTTPAYATSAPAKPPLVLADQFFASGVNVGAWKSPEKPMFFPTPGTAVNTKNAPFIFPTSRTPQTDPPQPNSHWWGSVAVSSARVGIKNSANAGDYVYNFPDAASREQWCQNWLQNLYLADVNVKLMPSKEQSDPANFQNSQVNGYDLDWDILQGAPVVPINESATSYLWDAILAGHQTDRFQDANWLNSFNGRADPRVSNALKDMQNRQGSRFDYGDSGMDAIVEH